LCTDVSSFDGILDDDPNDATLRQYYAVSQDAPLFVAVRPLQPGAMAVTVYR